MVVHYMRYLDLILVVIANTLAQTNIEYFVGSADSQRSAPSRRRGLSVRANSEPLGGFVGAGCGQPRDTDGQCRSQHHPGEGDIPAAVGSRKQ